MATLQELTASFKALQDHLGTVIADAKAHIAALEAQADPALLDPLKASIEQMDAALSGAFTPPAPAPEAAALFTFSGDPASIDLSAWPKAPVETADGKPLYTFSGGTVPSPLPDGWAPYTGQTQPVAAAA